jgi:hypothetical protein
MLSYTLAISRLYSSSFNPSGPEHSPFDSSYLFVWSIHGLPDVVLCVQRDSVNLSAKSGTRADGQHY